MKIYLRTPVKGSVLEVYRAFNKDLFIKLKPPFVKVDMKRFDGCHLGAEFHFVIESFPKSITWKGKVTEEFESENKCYFVDEGIELPFPLSSWKHKHKIEKFNNEVMIIDEIEFSVSSKLLAPVVYSSLLAAFTYRIPIYKRIFS